MAETRRLALDLVERHDRDDGVGPDPYQAVPQQHAMAEGKFLSAIAALEKCGLLKTGKFHHLAERSLARLESISLWTDAGRGFGLGFSYSDVAADVPYTITTAIVTEGLLAAASRSSSNIFTDMAAEARLWMTNDENLVSSSQGSMPRYAPTKDAIVTNVVSFWSSVLGDEHEDLTSRARYHVRQAYVMGVGWPYRADSSRFDLLHACYSARSLITVPTEAGKIATAISRFVTPTGFLDKFDLVGIEEAVLVASRASSPLVRIEEECGFVYFDAPARVWSLGELLVVAAMRPGASLFEGFWRAVERRVLAEILSADFSTLGPRHAMHAAHGLSLALERARGTQ